MAMAAIVLSFVVTCPGVCGKFMDPLCCFGQIAFNRCIKKKTNCKNWGPGDKG